MSKNRQLISFSNADIGYSRPIIEKFSGNLNRGDKIGILAPNGFGKTCLLQTIYGNIELLSGSLIVNGKISLTSQALQFPENFKKMTVEEFLMQKNLSLSKINFFSEKIFTNHSQICI